MKAFWTSFLLTALACFAGWHQVRRHTAHAPPVVSSPAIDPSEGGVAAAPVAAANLKAALEKTFQAANRWKSLTADQWAIIDALPGPEAASWAKTRAADHDDQLTDALIARWAETEPEAAMAQAKAMRETHPSTGDCGCEGGDPGGQFNHLPGEVLALWLRRDPAVAASVDISIPRKNWDFPSGECESETLAQTDFTRALEALASQRETNRDSLQSPIDLTIANGRPVEPDILCGQWDDPARRAEFARWLAACRDQTLAAAVFARVFSRAPHEGAWLRPERLPDFTPGRNHLPKTLDDPECLPAMGALALGENPVASVEQARRAAEVTGGKRKYGGWVDQDKKCMEAWAARDPLSASQWLEMQPLGPELDAALIGFGEGTRRFDAEAAVKWCGRITRPGTRLRECAANYVEWHRIDPPAAEAWLAQAGFSEFDRLYLAGQAKSIFFDWGI